MPKQIGENEDPRRLFLVKALSLGLFAAAGDASAQLFGRRPHKLPPGQSIYDMSGPVMVNGKLIRRDASINANDTIETGKRAQLIFVIGADAFILRENSKLTVTGNNFLVQTLRLAAGALLSVFGHGPKAVYGPTATIGIRGTGLYVESQPGLTYVCTCYGDVRIATADDPSIFERIVSKHHDAPRYVYGPGAAQRIVPAPFKDHDDLELMLIETLVGRRPPFSLFDEGYGSPRRY